MAKIKCLESTTVTSQLTGPFSLTVRSTDQLAFVVEYGEDFQVTLAMNALYYPLQEGLARLRGLDAAVATRVGWQHLAAYLDWAGSASWTAAIRGTTERLEIRAVALDYEQDQGGLWITGNADLQGTWSAAQGIDFSVMSGTTVATLDGTPGLPGFIAPAVAVMGENPVPLKGMARVGTWLCGQDRLPLVTFDASVAMDLERVYLAIAGMFLGDTFTWQEFLGGWEALFQDAVCTVRVRTGTYTLALVPSEQAYQENLRYYAQLSRYFCKQEEDYQHPRKRTSWWHDLMPSH